MTTDNKPTKTPRKKKLNTRQKKFVANKAKGMTQHDAYIEAGYTAKNKQVAKVNASKLANKPHIEQAIEDALEFHGATPEFAVAQIKKVAEQDDKLSEKRMASRDILELHGWRKGAKPNLTLDIKNAFFNQTRDTRDK